MTTATPTPRLADDCQRGSHSLQRLVTRPFVRVERGDSRTVLPTLDAASVQCCVTSPPYWGLRDYDHADQIGQEATPQEYVESIVSVMREVRRVLADDGTLWLNLGDSYARNGGSGGCGPNASVGSTKAGVQERNCKAPNGYKAKDLIGIPWRVALALQADGWWLRQDIIWHKPNSMPESVTDRCTKAHEYIFLLSKAESYHYDHGAIKERAERGAAGSRFDTGKTAEHQLGRASGAERTESEWRNKRSVWSVPTAPYREAHFATFPPDLIRPCILAGCPIGGTVLDPFGGSGTTGMVAYENGRSAVLIELNQDYAKLINERLTTTPGLPLAG